MNNFTINILDCTLRDGADMNKGDFGINNIKYIYIYTLI